MGVATAIIISTVVSAGVGVYAANKAGKNADNQQDNYEADLIRQQDQQAKLDKQKEEYKQFEFKNPYADMQNRFEGMENQYAGLQNQFEGMRNPFENLGVATQAAEFQAEQGTQQRANILDSLSASAGSSGIAGLAQTLANQGVMQSRQLAAGIEQQEMANQKLEAQGAFNVDRLVRGQASELDKLSAQGAYQADLMGRKGQSAVDMAVMGGEAMLQEAEMARQATLLGVEYGGMAGSNQAVQQGYANQMQSDLAYQQSIMNIGSNVAQGVNAYAGATQ
tara:strand:+ start:1304 stop:2140 length:837 start_codon:yes stop_codon:yes gene_type:complete